MVILEFYTTPVLGVTKETLKLIFNTSILLTQVIHDPKLLYS